jgi:hypothetical protein
MDADEIKPRHAGAFFLLKYEWYCTAFPVLGLLCGRNSLDIRKGWREGINARSGRSIDE